MKFSINFQTTGCTRCTGTRTLGSACPECGAAAPVGEVNRFVVARREGLRRLDAFIAQADPPRLGEHFEPTPNDLIECLESLLKAIPAFIKSPTSAETVAKLGGTIVRLRSTRDSVQRLVDIRPGIGMRLAMIESTQRLERVWELYRSALSAGNMSDAQASAREAQEVMDNAGGPVQSATELRELAEMLGNEERPIPERIVAALARRLPNLSLLEMPARGASAAQVALELPVGPNSGLSYLLLESIWATLLHPVRYNAKMRLASSGASDGSRVKWIALQEDALSSLAEAHRLMLEATVAYCAVLKVETDERAVARRTGKLAHEIYEAATPVFAWYRLLLGNQVDDQSFQRVSARDATALVSELQNSPLGAVFSDAAKYLRHAPVHGRSLDYKPETSEFVISLKSHTEIIGVADFLDRVLAFLETVLASIWSIENAIELAGVELSLSEADAMYMGFTPMVLTAITLPALSDIVVRHYENVGDRWIFRIESDSDLLSPALVAAGNAVGQAHCVELIASEEMPLTVQLADLEAWTQSSGHEMITRFLEFKASAERGGSSALENADVQFALARLGVALLNGDVSVIPLLRRLRALSQLHGWREEVRLAGEIMSSVRSASKRDLGRRLAALIRDLPIPQMPTSRAVRVIVSEPLP
jgi:hypothetical protein